MSPIETVSFERVQVVSRRVVAESVTPMVEFHEERLAMERANLLEAVLKGFGKTARFEFRCPSTWWQHIKHALKVRWPSIFGRLTPSYRSEAVDTGVVLAGVPEFVTAKHLVIPYLPRDS